MNGPGRTRARRPLRTAGWGMLGVAGAALLIGLTGVVTGEARISADERSTAASGLVPENAPAPVSSPPVVTTAPGGPTARSEPSSTRPGSTAAAPSGVNRSTRGEARVYNNSTINGLAAKAANDLDAAGWTVVDTANYSAGVIPTTTVYYEEGTNQRRIAEAIGAEFGMRVEPRFVGIADAKPGVIVIVTNDYGS